MVHQPSLAAGASLPYRFSQTGDYRILVQMRRGGRIETGVFDTRIAKLGLLVGLFRNVQQHPYASQGHKQRRTPVGYEPQPDSPCPPPSPPSPELDESP